MSEVGEKDLLVSYLEILVAMVPRCRTAAGGVSVDMDVEVDVEVEVDYCGKSRRDCVDSRSRDGANMGMDMINDVVQGLATSSTSCRCLRFSRLRVMAYHLRSDELSTNQK